jgi:CRP-like cAMP-binding protein
MARIEFIRLCQSAPELTYALLERAHNKISNLIEQVEVAAFQNTTAQVARLLNALWLETNRSRGSLGDLLRLTHQEIATATGRTRVSGDQRHEQAAG